MKERVINIPFSNNVGANSQDVESLINEYNTSYISSESVLRTPSINFSAVNCINDDNTSGWHITNDEITK